MKNRTLFLLTAVLLAVGTVAYARTSVPLTEGWRSTYITKAEPTYDLFYQPGFVDQDWDEVTVPHNWETYENYRGLRHGNLHGHAFYRTTFTLPKPDDKDAEAKTKEYFLYFEGVGSYATVWINGHMLGMHLGGRTTFTYHITPYLVYGKPNVVAVRADHPKGITDLPWVCGGCPQEWGVSEGSQPFGIFRPVHLVSTSNVRIEPFGVHVWTNQPDVSALAELNVNVELKNYTDGARNLTLVSKLMDKNKKTVTSTSTAVRLEGKELKKFAQKLRVERPLLWSPDQPNMYEVYTEVQEQGNAIDQVSTPYGIRSLAWSQRSASGDNPGRLLINGKPYLINGTAEHEHNMGGSHAFTDEQIQARVSQVLAAGFNAFRDAHQPHNLRYNQYWDEQGVMWWPQFSSHIWYDDQMFKNNFKQLLGEWVKERRNSPSVILWGLQNESVLPEEFAQECSVLIRELDPTATTQRLITTSNGGYGTDCNVPQNWSGTYGGNPNQYATDLLSEQLNAEYGAWRHIDLYTEAAASQQGSGSESDMTHLLESKLRQAEQVKDKISGHFQSEFVSNENPGRLQFGEGMRHIDQVGPINYKGLFTPWGEPVDAFYMYRSNYAPAATQPMVYIASHRWPDRWTTPGTKHDIHVYSNCEQVELWNDDVFLGTQTRQGGKGTHFVWDSAYIRYNTLQAKAILGGQVVATDVILLNHLPEAPHYNQLVRDPANILQPADKYTYLYRVNCGGPEYIDDNGNVWEADAQRQQPTQWGSTSWTDQYKGCPPFLGSQRPVPEVIHGTINAPLFRTLRYGRQQLQYHFPVPDGEYRVELYFVEPWYGVGGGLNCKGWRMFDVAINGTTLIKDLDIWSKVGHHYAYKEVLTAKVKGGELTVSFPRVKAGQAVISAIAIATTKKDIPVAPTARLITLQTRDKNTELQAWLATGQEQYSDAIACFSSLPGYLYGAEWVQTPRHLVPTAMYASIKVSQDADVYIMIDTLGTLPTWLKDFERQPQEVRNNEGEVYGLYKKFCKKGFRLVLAQNTQGSKRMYTVAAVPARPAPIPEVLRPVRNYPADEAMLVGSNLKKSEVDTTTVVCLEGTSDAIEWWVSVGMADVYGLAFRYINATGKPIQMRLQITADNDTKAVMRDAVLTLPPTAPGQFGTLRTHTGTYINTGDYNVRLGNIDTPGVCIDLLEVQ